MALLGVLAWTEAGQVHYMLRGGSSRKVFGVVPAAYVGAIRALGIL